MSIKLMEAKEPTLNPLTKEEELENIILYQGELMKYEIERGNDLCQIIMSLMDNNGPSGLTEAQKERVNNIRRNIENQKRWLAR